MTSSRRLFQLYFYLHLCLMYLILPTLLQPHNNMFIYTFFNWSTCIINDHMTSHTFDFENSSFPPGSFVPFRSVVRACTAVRPAWHSCGVAARIPWHHRKSKDSQVDPTVSNPRQPRIRLRLSCPDVYPTWSCARGCSGVHGTAYSTSSRPRPLPPIAWC